MVSAKGDIVSSQISIEESTRVGFLLISESIEIIMKVAQDMGIEPPVSISSKLGLNNLFHKIITAAQHPHLSIPETEAGKSRKHYNRLINRTLMDVFSTFSSVVLNLTEIFSQTKRKASYSCLVK